MTTQQMMIESIANKFCGGRKLKLIQESGSVGTDGLDTESQGLCDVLEGLALGHQYKDFEFSFRQCVMVGTGGILVYGSTGSVRR